MRMKRPPAVEAGRRTLEAYKSALLLLVESREEGIKSRYLSNELQVILSLHRPFIDTSSAFYRTLPSASFYSL
jgi:hypothetical protein